MNITYSKVIYIFPFKRCPKPYELLFRANNDAVIEESQVSVLFNFANLKFCLCGTQVQHPIETSLKYFDGQIIRSTTTTKT